jgi:dUTP pyrophosphatase
MDYRGECNVILFNTTNSPITIENGERIAQFVLCPVHKIMWNNVDNLDETVRGEGGFGHTGSK